ncbi:MAG: type II/IV secretion system protein [Candidatus Omnitrophica bacterium]|nr:type II/IV secretion system protein [Candidatus Omnitrophota bacterium]
MSVKRFGQLLLEKRLVSEAQLAEATETQKRDNRFLGAILLERGWLTPEQLAKVLAEYYQMPFVRLDETPCEPAAVLQVPLKVALHYQVMPVKVHNSTLTIAIANPEDVRLLDEVRLALHERYRLQPLLATADDVLRAVKKHYGVGAETINKILTERSGSAPTAGVEEEDLEDLERMASEASVMNLVNQLILEAHNRRATDIHLEPYRGKVKLRYRVDGMLHDVEVPPAIRQLFPAIISRVKVLSNLNIVERRLPQDGRSSVKVGEQKIDLRISVLPTPPGESVVIRILPNQMLLDLQDLGFREDDLKFFEASIRKPHGLIFVTGPTGSGKTTTLYACLKTINTQERKIITIEDPIEYELDDVTQVQVNPPIGLTFAQGLRSMLRHDPDVMMVGEIRDLETAELAIRIALTGHLVFSTLHTNDAAGSITRLLDMGIDPYLITSSVECIIGQRLVRVLCAECREAVASTRGEAETAFRSRGCKACHQSGFRGRCAIYEFFHMTQPIKELVMQKASAEAIQRAAVEMGMRTMREDGWEKVRAGVTTLDEVLRVTQDEM